MMQARRTWAQARRRLGAAVAALGYPREFADLMARQLGSPGAMDRMAGYLERARPASMEMIVDEMLAISEEIETWRKKKEGQAAQAGYSAWLSSEARWENLREDGEDSSGGAPEDPAKKL